MSNSATGSRGLLLPGAMAPKRKGWGLSSAGGQSWSSYSNEAREEVNDALLSSAQNSSYGIKRNKERRSAARVQWAYRGHYAYSSCVDLIAGSMITNGEDPGRRFWRAVPARDRNDEPIANPDEAQLEPFYAFVENCHRYLSFEGLLAAIVTQYVAANYVYAEVALSQIYNEFGERQPGALYLLPQGEIYPKIDDHGELDASVPFWQIRDGKEPRPFTWPQIFWGTCGMMPSAGVNPITPVDTLLIPINSTIQAERYIDSFWKSGTKLGAVFKNSKIGQEEAEEFLTYVRQHLTNTEQGHQPWVIWGDFEIVDPPKGIQELAEFFAIQKEDVNKVCSRFPVDPRLISAQSQGSALGNKGEREHVWREMLLGPVNARKGKFNADFSRQILLQGFGITDWTFELIPFRNQIDADRMAQVAAAYVTAGNAGIFDWKKLEQLNVARKKIDAQMPLATQEELDADEKAREEARPAMEPEIKPGEKKPKPDDEDEDVEDMRGYNPNQDRDDDGKFGSGGGSYSGSKMKQSHDTKWSEAESKHASEKKALDEAHAKEKAVADQGVKERFPHVARQEAEVADMDARHDSEVQAHDAKESAMHERHDAEASELEEAQSDEKATLKAKQRNERAGLARDKVEAAVEKHQGQQEKLDGKHEQQREKQESRHESEQAAHDKERDKIDARHEDERGEMLERHEKQDEEHEDLADAGKDRLQREKKHEREKKELEGKHHGEKAKLAKEFREDMAAKGLRSRWLARLSISAARGRRWVAGRRARKLSPGAALARDTIKRWTESTSADLIDKLKSSIDKGIDVLKPIYDRARRDGFSDSERAAFRNANLLPTSGVIGPAFRKAMKGLYQVAQEQAKAEIKKAQKDAASKRAPKKGPMDNWIEAFGEHVFDDLYADVTSELRSTFLTGLKSGWDLPEFVAQLKARADGVADRDLTTIVRTSSTDILNIGRQNVAEEAGIEAYEYQAVVDDRTAPICEEANGLQIGIHDPDVDRIRPPNHYNCFPAGTPILTECGERQIELVQVGERVLTQGGTWERVEAQIASDYTGEMIEIEMEDGRVIAATANHPIWTSNRGWVEAGSLIADDVLVDAPRNEVMAALYRGGMTCRQVGRAIGITSPQVSRLLRKIGVELRQGSEAIKTQWVSADERRSRQAAAARERFTGKTPNFGRLRPDSSARMKTDNPMRDPDIKRRADLAKIGKQAGSKNPMYGRPAPNGGKTGYRHGRRADIGRTYFRSTWEANLARLYNATGVEWFYEPHAFALPGGRTYRPDFYLPASDTWVELKGMWREDARKKFDLFRESYPNLRVELIDDAKYTALAREHRDTVTGWER